MVFNPVNKKNNMNVVRYYLCLCILMNHYNVLTGAGLPMLPRIFGGVGSFFALSGFLMFSSYERHQNIKGYALRRAKRILPPYIFIVLLAAGSLSSISILSPHDYFLNPQFWKYLLYNLIFLNFIEPSLPGVFQGDSMITDVVNGSLWTMKGEVICYLAVPFIYRMIAKHPEKASKMIITLMAVCFTGYISLWWADYCFGAGLYVIAKQFRIFLFFFTGALINVNFKKFLKYKWQVLGCVIAMIAIASLSEYIYIVLRPFSDSMLVIWCSMIGSWGAWLSRYNAVSYQVYLFHFPIIQVLLACGVISQIGFVWGLATAIVLSFALAAVSWNLIDKPILNYKRSDTKTPFNKFRIG